MWLRDRISSILMSRFILNLRQIAERQVQTEEYASRFSRFTAPNFHIPDVVIGNLGATLGGYENDAETEPSRQRSSPVIESDGVPPVNNTSSGMCLASGTRVS